MRTVRTVIYRPSPSFPDYYAGMDGTIVSGRLGRALKQTPDAQGYLRVALLRDGRQFIEYVHNIMLEAFYGPCPLGLERLHADDNPANNWLGNLSYGTHAENMAALRGSRRLLGARSAQVMALVVGPVTPREIADKLGLDNKLVAIYLDRFVRTGRIIRLHRGVYAPLTWDDKDGMVPE